MCVFLQISEKMKQFSKQAAAEKVKYDIEGRKSAIKLLEETRDSEDFKYKTVT